MKCSRKISWMKTFKITERQIKMGLFTMLALVLAPIIASFMAEITLHFATKTPAIEAASPPPPPVVHQTIVNHYYGPGGPPMEVPEVSPTTTTTASTTSTTGRIPHRDYLEAVHISRMMEKRMEDAADDEEQREELEKNLDQLITSTRQRHPIRAIAG